MATNNSKGTTNPLDNELKENVNNTSHVPNDSTTHVNETLAATTGGQVRGGVVASSGSRMESENEKGSEGIA